MAINKNAEIKKLHTFGDKIADTITAIAGSMAFLWLNVIWFTAWLLLNLGVFGDNLVFDEFPFGLLTMIVSLEAIILSTFVLVSQRRESETSELRSELDYRTDLQTEADIRAMLGMLERVAKKQGIDVSDLVGNMKTEDKKILKMYPEAQREDQSA